MVTEPKFMSASKQRKAAAEGDHQLSTEGVPTSMNEKQTKKLYNSIRAAMGIKEGWSLKLLKFDWKILEILLVKIFLKLVILLKV